MNKTIILSPWSKNFDPNKENPKNYPYWNDLVNILHNDGYQLVQIGMLNEKRIDGVDEWIVDKSFAELEPLIRECITWISVDNFFPHFCNCVDPTKWGIVLWAKSNPDLFGYKHNINLYKSKKFFRLNQFDVWFNESYVRDAFVKPQMVMSAIRQKLQICRS